MIILQGTRGYPRCDAGSSPQKKGEVMNVFVRFLNEYGTAILYAAATALVGAAGVALKHLWKRRTRDRRKKKVVKQCMQAVDTVYSKLSERERDRKTVKAVEETLADEGISMAKVETLLHIGEERDREAKRTVAANADSA